MRKSGTVAIVALVFISEVLAIGSYSIWSSSVTSSDWLPYAIGLAGLVVWLHTASTVGHFSGPVFTPVARAVLYGLAVVAVWDAGHHTLAVVQACVFVAPSELSRVPGVQEMIARAHGMARMTGASPSSSLGERSEVGGAGAVAAVGVAGGAGPQVVAGSQDPVGPASVGLGPVVGPA